MSKINSIVPVKKLKNSSFLLPALLTLPVVFLFGIFAINHLRSVLAINDTTQIWNFDSANAGSYSFDNNLVTVDNSGARPKANKITNPSFTTDNSSWSVSSAPPSGWVEVPGNQATYSTSNFLVMKYEAKCAATTDLTTGLTAPDTGANTYANNTTACTAANNRAVVSVPSGFPIANISQTTSATYCTNIKLGNNTSAHLINNNEWMTIARNTEAQNANWSGGTVGSGYLFAGHNDTSPGRALRASTTDTGNSACAYTDSAGTNEAPAPCPTNIASNTSGSTGNQKRVHQLSNGSYIWDLAGNLYEWNNNTITGVNQPDVAGQSGLAWRQYTALTSYGSLSYDLLRPLNSGYNSTQGIGQIYHDSNSANATTYGFLRGGTWSLTSYAGVFTLGLDFTPGYTYFYLGFRCASDPVEILQSHSSGTGRSGGGNTITVGNVADAKLTQSIDVGGSDAYDFSTYVYDKTVNNEGGTVSSAVAQLYYNGSVIDTTYTNVGSGWWKLSGTVTGANASREYGVLVKVGKTVVVDDFTLTKSGTYSIYTTSAYTNNMVASWDSFSANITGDTNRVRFQICNDDGSVCESGNSWKYYDGDSWETASNITTHTNLATELTTQAMQALPIASQKISVKAIFNFEVESFPTLNSFEVGLTTDTIPPDTNASDIVMKKAVDGSTLNSNSWTNGSAPYFSWEAGADNTGGSGLLGYCLYLGTDETADPATAKGLLGTSPVSTTGSTCQFIIGSNSINFATLSYRGSPWLTTSNDPYFLNIKAVDVAGNVYSGSSAQFKFRFDNTLPTNPSYISAPSDFISTKSTNILWPSTGTDGPSDSNSGVAGLQYRIGTSSPWYGDNHTGTQDFTDLLANDGTYKTVQDPDFANIQEGANIIYMRTWDNAGNVSDSTISSAIKVNTLSPSSPKNLKVSTEKNDTNEYEFSWDQPDSFTGQASNLTYCYTINTVPTSTNCNYSAPGAQTLSKDAYATQPGENNLYLVARDEAGNINYSTYTSVTFSYTGSAPGIPRNIDVSDISIKATKNWKLTVSWDPPTNLGAGIKSYKIFRSITNKACSSSIDSFSQIGTTSGTSYSDTGLQEKTYYYCVRACDSANNCSAVSQTVSRLPTGRFFEPAKLTSDPKVTDITTRRAKISWVTDRDSDSRIAFGTKSENYFDEEPSNSNQVTDHKITLTNLEPGKTYYYTAKWTDEDGNIGKSDEQTFKTQPAPTTQNVKTKNIGLSSANIEFTTKGASSVKVYYGKTTDFGAVREIATSTSEATYTVELIGLDDGTKYYYQINVLDSEGAEYEGTILDFTTFPRPRISNVRMQEVRGTAQPTVLVTWESNTEVSSIVTYYPENELSAARDEVNLELKEGEHQMLLKGLRPETSYILIAKGRDTIGNEAVSDSQRFTTSTDTRPPLVTNLKIEGTTVPPVSGAGQEARAQLIVSWDTDEPSTSQIEYGEGTGGAYTQKTQEDSNLTLNHLVIISDLTPSKVYSLRVISKDRASNIGRSPDTVTISPKSTESALDLVIGNLAAIFGFLGR